MTEDVAIDCCFCGERIYITVEVLGGRRQDYVEDCSVCCNPNVIHVEVDADLDVTATATPGD